MTKQLSWWLCNTCNIFCSKTNASIRINILIKQSQTSKINRTWTISQSSDRPVVSRSKKANGTVFNIFYDFFFWGLVVEGMVEVLFTLIYSKPIELSYVTPSLSCCWLPELLLLSFSCRQLFWIERTKFFVSI